MSWWLKLHDKKLQRASHAFLRELHQAQKRHPSERIIRELQGEPKVLLGTAASGLHVRIPLDLLTHFGITVGASGCGKSMAICLPMLAMLEAQRPFGLIDAKSELFDRAIYMLSHFPELWEDVYIIDFNNREAISPYNILYPIGEFDYFITRRAETLKELLPGRDRLSLRGSGLLKQCLALLAETGQTILAFDRLLTDAVFRAKLLKKCRRAETRYYFQKIFPKESGQSIVALQARISALFDSESVKLALGGATAPDFVRMMDQGKIVLVNCAGPQITKGVRILLQSIVLSDIRQSIFARTNRNQYVIWCDEAQNFLKTPSQQEDIQDALNMGRSFGTFFHFICQHLETAVSNREILQILHQNLRWSFTMRSVPQDCLFLRNHLPVTGMMKPRRPFQEPEMYTPSEERTLLHEGIAKLPDREGYFWLKTKCPEAVRMKTTTLNFGEDFDEIVSEMKSTPEFGYRIAPKDYEKEESTDVRDVFRDMEEGYPDRTFKKDF